MLTMKFCQKFLSGTQCNYHRRRRGGQGALAPLVPPKKKFGKKYFSIKNHVKFGNFVNFLGKYRVKFGHFVNFSCIYVRAKMSCPPKLTELLRLWQL